MSKRIANRFRALKDNNRAGLIPYIMGGDPDLDTAAAILKALPKAGADFIEIGIPFSDPMADGPVIQAAGKRALDGGTKLVDILNLVRDFREQDSDTPIILMGYYNPIYRFGAEHFCEEAKDAGVDGLIIVDLPPEEENEILPHSEKHGIALVRLVAPTSVPNRLPSLLAHTKGFIYYISITGITGGKGPDMNAMHKNLQLVEHETATPVAVGFGVKTPEQAALIGKEADAVVVGSALVDIIDKASKKGEAVQQASDFVKSLSDALRSATK